MVAADEALDAGNRVRARELWRLALRHDDAMFLADVNLGAELHGAGRNRDGLPWLRGAVRKVPRFVPALRKLGVVLSALGDSSGALEAFGRARDADPLDARLAVYVAESMHAIGRARDALREPGSAAVHTVEDRCERGVDVSGPSSNQCVRRGVGALSHARLHAEVVGGTPLAAAFGAYPLGMRGWALLALGRRADALEAVRVLAAARERAPRQAPWAFMLVRACDAAALAVRAAGGAGTMGGSADGSQELELLANERTSALAALRALLREAHAGRFDAGCEPQDSLCAANNKLEAPQWRSIDDKVGLHRILGAPGLPRACAVVAPATFEMPDQATALRAHDAAVRAHAGNGVRAPLWILKDRMGHGGAGNVLLGELHSTRARQALASAADCVVQRYVERPLLLDGRKFSLRLYIVTTRVAPLRAYVARTGLCLLAAAPYAPHEGEHVQAQEAADIDMHAHITNQSFNNTHADYFVAGSNSLATAEAEGNTRPLSALAKLAAARGLHYATIWQACVRACAAALRAASSSLEEKVGDVSAADADRAAVPKVLGVDLLLDQSGTPWLLEVNRHVALGERGPVDNRVKRDVVRAAWEAALEHVGEVGDDGETSRTDDGSFNWQDILQPLDLCDLGTDDDSRRAIDCSIYAGTADGAAGTVACSCASVQGSSVTTSAGPEASTFELPTGTRSLDDIDGDDA